MALLRASATFSSWTGLSRLTGFGRDLMIAIILGVSPLADIFVMALVIPSLFRSFTGEGAFSSAFVPRYSGLRTTQGQAHASDFAAKVIGLIILVTVLITGVVWAAAPWIMPVMVPWLEASQTLKAVAVNLLQITITYVILVSLVALLGGLLTEHDVYAPLAGSQVIYNLLVIFAAWVSVIVGGQTVYFMAWAVIGAGSLQLLWVLIVMIRRRIVLPLRQMARCLQFDDRFKDFMRGLGPAVLASCLLPISTVADNIMAAWLGTGNVSQIYYASRLYQLPYSLVAIAFAAALIPSLSRFYAKAAHGPAADLLRTTLLGALMIAVPAAVGIAILAQPIIQAVYAYGAFTDEAAVLVGRILMIYALVIPPLTVVKILTSSFFAQKDTTTPFKLLCLSVALNISTSLISIQFIGVMGIALGTAVASWTHAAVIWWMHQRRRGSLIDDRGWRWFGAIILAVLGMAAGVWGLRAPILYLTMDFGGVIVALLILIPLGMLIYGGLAQVLGLRALLGQVSRA
ncbi:MAG: murein biosynthesis integral membrane protein MurJ [Pseudomonadota bacterium]